MGNQANSRIEAEVVQFDAVGDQWWDEQGPFRPLHALNPVRMQYLVGQIGAVSGKQILDIACGGGLVTEPFARLGAKVIGIDTSANAIAAARKHAAGEGLDINYQVCSLEEFADKKTAAKFDVITALEILEHVAEPADFIQTATKLLKPGGVMIFSTLNRTVKSLLFAKIAAEEILGIVPRGTHNWRQFIQPAELAEMAEAAALTVTDITGLTFNPAQSDTKAFALSKKDIAINYFLTARK